MSNELLTEYTKTVNEFLAEVDGITPGDLSKSPKAGEWSVGFVIHHMADSEVHFSSRFLNALSEDRPKIVPFNEEVYPERLNYSARDVAACKAVVASLSIFVTSLLMGISADDWKRISIHPENGEMTLIDLLTKVISHYRAHIGQIKEIKAAL
jgi:uncharacterized damage-inducible protein DinB